MEVLNQPISPENILVPKNKDSEFSIVDNAKDTGPKKAETLKRIYEIIKSNALKNLIEVIRAEPDEAKKKRLKAKLMAFIVGGTFTVRNDKGLLIYAGLVHADVDKLNPSQMIEFVEILRNSPFIALFFVSPSGKGFKIFAWVNTPAEQHLRAWTQFNKYISDLLGVATDTSPKSIVSLCFFSHDPTAFYNENSEIFEVIEVIEPEQTTKANDSLYKKHFEQQNGTVDQIDRYILKASENAVNGFEPNKPRHTQIAKTKSIYGYLKQYPQNTVFDEVNEMFVTAMSTHLYGSISEAKAQNAFKSLATAREEAEPLKSEAIEKIIRGAVANIDSREFRNKFKIDVNEAIPPPQIAWSFLNLTGFYAILGTLGNFSLITGKAKAKKSFLICIAVAIALIEDLLHGRFKSSLPDTQKDVLFFDTEQSKYHVQLAVRRICSQIGVAEPNNLHAFHLRSLNPSERLQFIEAEIYANENIGFVVIDGIKDLVTSINDEAEASMIASKLLKWTEERNIHIVTVLHQNKGDTNARGHIGTELINKAETVLSVTVLEHDKEISIVEPQQCRNREPESFAFKIDENGIPFIISEFDTAKPKKENAANVYTLQNEKLYEVITDAFSNDNKIKYAELVRRVKASYNKIMSLSIGDNKARDLISLCKGNGFIEQRAEREPYILLPYIEDDDLL